MESAIRAQVLTSDISVTPSLHWHREGSIFWGEAEKPTQRHVAGRQHLSWMQTNIWNIRVM